VADVAGAASTVLSPCLSHPEHPEAMDAPARSAMKTSGSVVERAMAARLARFAGGD
jgi:hypothetical protein